MRIETLLTENREFSELSPLQIGTLRKIKNGKFNYDGELSPQVQDAVELLVSLGMVDDISFDITPKGEEALSLADQYGSVDRQNLLQAKEKMSNNPRQYVDRPDQEIELY